MLRTLAVAIMSAAIGLMGLQRCAMLKSDLRQLNDYARGLERLESAIRFQRAPLPSALAQAAQESGNEVGAYFSALSQSLEDDVPVPNGLKGMQLRMSAMCAALDLDEQLRHIERQKTEVQAQTQRRGEALRQQCRTTVSLSLCLGAICAIVLI